MVELSRIRMCAVLVGTYRYSRPVVKRPMADMACKENTSDCFPLPERSQTVDLHSRDDDGEERCHRHRASESVGTDTSTHAKNPLLEQPKTYQKTTYLRQYADFEVCWLIGMSALPLTWEKEWWTKD
eukprot:scpid27706/ scgid20033/ 